MNKILCQSQNCRPDHRGGPRRVDGQRPICRWCADSFGGNVTAIAQMWPDLQARLVPSDPVNERVSGSRTPGLVIDETVSRLISEVTEWVWSLVRIVLDETTSVKTPNERHTQTLLLWLARWHTPRLIGNDNDAFVVALVDWAVYYRWLVHRRAYPSGARRVEIPGRCDVVDDGRRCDGALFAVVRTDSSLLPSEIKCELNDDHAIPSGRWATLGKRLGLTRDEQLDTISVGSRAV